jgi:hypothetical protein
MTNIKIEDIKNGAEYDGAIWDYWITATLKNNTRIELFDPQDIDLNKFKGQWIQAEIKSLFVEAERNDELLELEGAVSLTDGKYLFSNNEIEIQLEADDTIPMNKIQKFYFGRLDLVGYQPLDK